ncbi:hypothetical protein XA68_14584 [Ophiocordyceps unilateralis]|uniref:Uncharacterized protein n=1 Tax=Ophiocordyceps unilateralis TaxID=268505 RepID=A0A2A9P8E6_OPHUN|nr:hypothetical protein XA68_14584 [Ophiocordyceps unilateralis]
MLRGERRRLSVESSWIGPVRNGFAPGNERGKTVGLKNLCAHSKVLFVRRRQRTRLEVKPRRLRRRYNTHREIVIETCDTQRLN